MDNINVISRAVRCLISKFNMWTHWQTGEEWMSESDYIYQLVMYSFIFDQRARQKQRLYYQNLRKNKKRL